MTNTANIAQSVDFFEAAERKFFELTDTLQTRHTLAMKFSDIEKLIEKDGRELMRLLLQAHVDSRGSGDIGLSLEGTDNNVRSHKRIGERQIKSIFGTLQLVSVMILMHFIKPT